MSKIKELAQIHMVDNITNDPTGVVTDQDVADAFEAGAKWAIEECAKAVEDLLVLGGDAISTRQLHHNSAIQSALDRIQNLANRRPENAT